MADVIAHCGARGAHCTCSLPPHHDGPHECKNLTLWETECGVRWTGDSKGDDFEIVALLPGSGTE